MVVTPDTRVSEVLSAHPELLDALVDASPAFARLRHPLLRRTMPNLVTIAQAARIGHLEPGQLVRLLNARLGVTSANATTPPEESKLGTMPPNWRFRPVALTLDVRPILAEGGEPFGVIRNAARKVPQGQQFVLEAPFEPLPLYAVLERQGFDAWCERVGEHTYRARFYRAANGEDVTSVPPSDLDWSVVHAEVEIEAALEPPEPMRRVLEALALLNPGEHLLVHHVRRPVHLLDRVAKDGGRYALRDLGPGKVDVLIRKG